MQFMMAAKGAELAGIAALAYAKHHRKTIAGEREAPMPPPQPTWWEGGGSGTPSLWATVPYVRDEESLLWTPPGLGFALAFPPATELVYGAPYTPPHCFVTQGTTRFF